MSDLDRDDWTDAEWYVDDLYEDDVDRTCPTCHGEGGWHDCGEDSCCCLDPDEITHTCPTCGGSGEV